MPHVYESIPETSSDLPHHYDTINDSGIYSKGEPTDFMMYNWYHGNISEELADIALQVKTSNTFLVRHSDNKLILSYTTKGWKSHDIINHSPEGYCLEGKDIMFTSVVTLIRYYQQFPIREDQVLGTAADKDSSGMIATTIFLFV